MTKLFHTYILGLPKKFRGEILEATLQEYGLEFTRVSAVEPIQLNELDIRVVKFSKYFSIIPPLTPGEICCAFGHKLIYTKIVEGNQEWALVFEDDAILRINPGFIEIGDLDPTIPTILQLSPDPTKHVFSRKDTLDNLDPDSRVVKSEKPQYETCAYFINKKAAQHMLKLSPMNLITGRADWPLGASKEILFLRTKVFCAYQIREGEESQIAGRDDPVLKIPLFFQVVRGFARVLGFTSFLYKLQGAPFRASYDVEVTQPLLERLSCHKC